MRPLLILLGGVAVLMALVWALLSQFGPAIPPRPTVDRLTLDPTSFSALNGWTQDQQASALAAFLRSCDRWQPQPDDRALASFAPEFGTMADWRTVCDQGRAVAAGDDGAARRFFEGRFTPFIASNQGDEEGLFTGYYEPELHGSLTPSETYSVPLHQRPTDLITVDLGEFRADLRGRRVAGRIEGTKLRPYASRADIVRAPSDSHDPLVFVDDPVDAFFLHIQGSGRVTLDNGEVMRVGYAAQNGHPYTAVGRVLVRDGHMPLEDVTMQSIRQWLTDNPDKAADLMNENKSYVYFRKLDVASADLGPLGAQSVPLTTKRSLAVDLKHWPLGVPLWLDTTLPPEKAAAETTSEEAVELIGIPFQRLMIAQDTGGAIRGPIRGDVFLGFGDAAGDVAGRMKQPGRFTVLLPNALAEPLFAKPAS